MAVHFFSFVKILTICLSCRLRARPLDGFLNHDISLRVAGVGPGGRVALAALVYPLRRGALEFADIYILDAVSGEIFCSSNAFTMLII